MSGDLTEAVAHSFYRPGHLAPQHSIPIYIDSCTEIQSDRVRVEVGGSEGEVKEVNFVDFQEVSLLLWRVLDHDIKVDTANHAHYSNRPK